MKILKEEVAKYKDMEDIKYKCKCGHTIYISRFKNNKICNWCGNKVYKSEKDEFKDKLERLMRK